MSVPLSGPLCDYDSRIISLLGAVDSSQIDLVLDQLLRLDAESADGITVYISARGGNMIDAFKLADAVGLLRSTSRRQSVIMRPQVSATKRRSGSDYQPA